jgi:hypothetical protein
MKDGVSIQPEFLPGHHFFRAFDCHGAYLSTCHCVGNTVEETIKSPEARAHD